VQEDQLRILRSRVEHHIIGRRAYVDEAMRPIVLNRCPFQTLVEVGGEDRRNPALVKDLGQRDVAPGRGHVRRVDEPLKEFPAIALDAQQIVDRVGVKVC
jgi:hypothetical protein